MASPAHNRRRSYERQAHHVYIRPGPGRRPEKNRDDVCETQSDDPASDCDPVLARLAAIETLLATLVEQQTVKEWYSTAEVAGILRRAEFTVREWCRLGCVRAEKKKCGRGPASEWIICHAELTRVRNEGLLPDARL